MAENFSLFSPEVYADTGSRESLDEVFSLAYEELRRLAGAVRRRDHAATLSPTTLVNEAWLKLAQTPEVASASHLHFKRIAARAMRQVLVTAARKRNALKRGANAVAIVAFDEALDGATSSNEELLALDAALDELARINQRQAIVVENRFFGGLNVDEIATLLGISEATVLRDWRVARAWLSRQLRRDA